MAGLLDSVLGIVGDVANWATGSQSNKKTQNMLSELQSANVIAPATLQAENMYAEQANEGLPGFQSMLSEEKSMLPTTLNQVRDSVNSGQLMDLVTKLYTKQNQGINQLSIANANAKLGNRQKFSGFLSGAMTTAEQRKQDINTGLTISKDEVRQQGVKDEQGYLSDILGQVGGGADSILGGGGLGGGSKGGSSSSMSPIGGGVDTINN